ncbi:MAG: tetratricopeptide repeat protein, partial [Chloroflexota bacterium]
SLLRYPRGTVYSWLYYRVDVGDALAALGKYQEAIENYEKVIEGCENVKEDDTEVDDFDHILDAIDAALIGKFEAFDHLEEWLTARGFFHDYVELYRLVTATEERLHLFIRQRLQQAFGEEESGWWSQGIPLAIRQKCAQRREEDPRRRDYYNYTDLIDLKDIVDKNWKPFELDFQRVKGQIKSKREFLDNLVKLNEIRKIVMHPVRGAPTEDDFELARKMREVIESFAGPG